MRGGELLTRLALGCRAGDRLEWSGEQEWHRCAGAIVPAMRLGLSALTVPAGG